MKQTSSAVQPVALGIDAISEEVLRVVKGKKVVWKPAVTSASESGRWSGLEYLRQGSKVRQAWEARWPCSVAIPAWDWVGRVQVGQGGCWEWVCVKVFQDPGELTAGSPPQQAALLHRIGQIIEEAKHTSRAPAEANWIAAGFNVAALIAVRAYLSSRGSCGRMVFLCVGGDEWQLPIEEAKERFGIGLGSAVANRLSWTLVTR